MLSAVSSRHFAFVVTGMTQVPLHGCTVLPLRVSVSTIRILQVSSYWYINVNTWSSSPEIIIINTMYCTAHLRGQFGMEARSNFQRKTPSHCSVGWSVCIHGWTSASYCRNSPRPFTSVIFMSDLLHEFFLIIIFPFFDNRSMLFITSLVLLYCIFH